MKIGIILLTTNAYFVLGLRFIKKFIKHYEGNHFISFYVFSDENPIPYLRTDINVKYYPEKHLNWVEATNSKFKNIIKIKDDLLKETDYIYYFDADTNINQNFTEEWFLGDMVAGEHYGNRSWLKNGSGFDRNPLSKAYVPLDTQLPCTYYYGAFFGGKTNKIINMCEVLIKNQMEDKKINYEPGVNDESYLNQFFHFNPPFKTVYTEDFKFIVSDKGGIGETRNPNLDISSFKNSILNNINHPFELQSNILNFI